MADLHTKDDTKTKYKVVTWEKGTNYNIPWYSYSSSIHPNLGFVKNIVSIINTLINLKNNLDVCGDYYTPDIDIYTPPADTENNQSSPSVYTYYITKTQYGTFPNVLNDKTIDDDHKNIIMYSPIQKLLYEKIRKLTVLIQNIDQFNYDTIIDPYYPTYGDLDRQYIKGSGKTSSVLKYYNQSTQEFETKPDGYYVYSNLFDMETKTILGKYISDLNDNITKISNLLNQHNTNYNNYTYSYKTWDNYDHYADISKDDSYELSLTHGKNKCQTYWEENNKIATVTNTINTLFQPFETMLNRFIRLQNTIKAFRCLYDSYQDVLVNINDFVQAYSEISNSQDKSMAATNNDLNNVGYFSTYSTGFLAEAYNCVIRAISLRDNSKWKEQDSDNQYLNDIAYSLCLTHAPYKAYQISFTKDNDSTEYHWYWKDNDSYGASLSYFDACTYLLNFILEVRKAYSI